MGFFDAKYDRKIVCFIDILGFSNIIKRTTKTSDSINFELQNIHDALKFIHSHFSEVGADLGDIIQVSQFSDSIVVSFSANKYEEMIVLFKNFKYVQARLLSDYKILMRGGIVIGDVLHNQSLLLGPAMIDAHTLESKCAMSPRIVIDPKVIYRYQKAVNALAKFGVTDEEITIQKDFDDTYYIDYFNFNDIDFYLNGNPKEYFTSICEIIRDNINSSDISIRVKYLWMRNKLKGSSFYKKGSVYKAIYKRIVTDKQKSD